MIQNRDLILVTGENPGGCHWREPLALGSTALLPSHTSHPLLPSGFVSLGSVISSGNAQVLLPSSLCLGLSPNQFSLSILSVLSTGSVMAHAAPNLLTRTQVTDRKGLALFLYPTHFRHFWHIEDT